MSFTPTEEKVLKLLPAKEAAKIRAQGFMGPIFASICRVIDEENQKVLEECKRMIHKLRFDPYDD